MNPKTLTTLEFDKVLARLARHTSFSAGRALALALLPSTDYAEVVDRQRITAEARRLLEMQPNLSLGGAHDVRPQVQKAALAGVLEPSELLDIQSTLSLAASLRNTIHRLGIQGLPLLSALAEGLADLSPLAAEISRCINPRSELVDTASPMLSEFRRQTRIAHDRLTAKLQHILSSQKGRQAAQEPIVTLRDGRYVIPITAEMRGHLQGIVHDVSSSGATVFLEPLEAVELGNAWRELQLEEQREVERILRALSDRVGQAAAEIETTVQTIAELDLALAKAKLGEALACNELPYLSDDQPWLAHGPAELRLVNARHPLLTGKVVPISIWVGDSYSIVLITGPNTGGKTVALKTVGLLTLMAQAGLPIPADLGSRIPVFGAVHADIGDEQSIEQSLSTFSSHVGNIIHILSEAKRNTLVLLDELGAGTDPSEGTALAQAILQHLLDVEATTVATTHHGQLKLFAHTTPGIVNASVEFDLETLAPTYRLSIGLPGQSNALAIADRLGMPADVLQRAREHIAPDRQELESLLAEIQRERQQAADAARAEQIARREAEAIRAGLAEKLIAVDAEHDRTIEKTRLEMERELQQTRASLRTAAKEIARAEREAAAAAAKEALEAARQKVEAVEERVEKVKRKRRRRRKGPLPPIAVGDRLWLRDLSQPAEALGPPDEHGELAVRLGAFHGKINVKEIESVDKAEEVPTVATSLPPSEPPPPELEVRGMTIDEALPLIDQHLDAAFRAGLPQVRIVHGRGTGTLRRAIRDALSEHPLVKSISTPPLKEGGEGVTLVEVAR
ncbi:MAG: endonuclease MutS2 [Dehalococcoidia bacterium]|nr:MAG: endonuclease MutS2 [Dehalococcoidia bacterium]